MGCYKLVDTEYKGKIKRMSSRNNRAQEKNKPITNNNDTKNNTATNINDSMTSDAQFDFSKLYEEIVDLKSNVKTELRVFTIIATVCAALLVPAVTLLFTMNATATSNTKLIEQLQGTISNFETRLNTQEQNNAMIKGSLGMITNLNNQDETLSFLDDVSIQDNAISETTAALEADIIIGKDADGITYHAADLIGKTILLSYKENERDVYFLGQYNEKYYWDGYCVTNTYNADGSLYSVCESNFDNGRRLDYKTVISINAKEDRWDYYSRKFVDGERIGTSIEYIFEYKKVKDFTNTNVRSSDILVADDFVKKQNARILQYYYGKTADGLYSDDTGSAFLIKFFDDGTVKSLYKGNFVNGKYNDNTGRAWNIIFAENCGYYVCNTGIFVNNKAIIKSNQEFSEQEIIQQIEPLIKVHEKCRDLNWRKQS